MTRGSHGVMIDMVMGLCLVLVIRLTKSKKIGIAYKDLSVAHIQVKRKT